MFKGIKEWLHKDVMHMYLVGVCFFLLGYYAIVVSLGITLRRQGQEQKPVTKSESISFEMRAHELGYQAEAFKAKQDREWKKLCLESNGVVCRETVK